MRRQALVLLAVAVMLLTVLAPAAATPAADPEEGYSLGVGPVFDIAAAPDGSLLAVGGFSVWEIRHGQVSEVITGDFGSKALGLNGIAALGRGSYLVTTLPGDLAVGAGVWRVSPGGVRLLGDIEAFETEHDPDAFAGPQWKDQRCEDVDPFSAGPQSNPYHLEVHNRTALVADAAGNTLLAVDAGGQVDLVAVFTPPTDDSGSWIELFRLSDDTPCYVQPVPTAVDIGPDGAYYVGELTGATPGDPVGLSRVWRIEPGARNVVCPSAECEVVLEGFTSLIDLAFGPDGLLYLVEYDVKGWLAALGGEGKGGAIRACDLSDGLCQTIEDKLVFPGTITFDKRGNLWLLESNLFNPVVRPVDLD